MASGTEDRAAQPDDAHTPAGPPWSLVTSHQSGSSSALVGSKFEWSFPLDISTIDTFYSPNAKIVSNLFTLPDGKRARLVVAPRAGPKLRHLAAFLALEAVPVDSLRNRNAIRDVKKNIASEANMLAMHLHIVNAGDAKKARGEVAGRTWSNLKTVAGVHGSERLVTHQQLLREPERYAPAGSMTLRATVLMNKTDADAVLDGAAAGGSAKSYESFCARMYARLRVGADGGDMMFAPGSGCPSGTVGAHKLVIGASCPVLTDVFREADQRGATAKMRITCPTGVTMAAVQMFVKFAYLGGELDAAVVKSADLMQQLFTMADVFRFEALCDACVPYVKPAMTVDTCCDMAINARKSGCKRMEDLALRFLCDHTDAIMTQPGAMDKFNDVPEMALEVLKHIAAQKTDKKRPRAVAFGDDEDGGDSSGRDDGIEEDDEDEGEDDEEGEEDGDSDGDGDE